MLASSFMFVFYTGMQVAYTAECVGKISGKCESAVIEDASHCHVSGKINV